MLRVFVAVALKEEIKPLFCSYSVQFRKAKGNKAVGLQVNIDLMMLVYFLMLFFSIIHIFMARNC